MINDLRKFFINKKVLILGFGREGRSTYKVVRKLLPQQKFYIADGREDFWQEDRELSADDNIECFGGAGYLDNLGRFEIIVKTPGIALTKEIVEKCRGQITSQTALFLNFFRGKTIGVTGTKGKSTTSSLIYKILDGQNVSSLLLGNIGVPVFDYIDELTPEKTVVLEMSSYQLELVKNSPQIAIYLDLFEEHLDFHGSFENYANAKANIFRFQNKTDSFLYGFDNLNLRNLVASIETEAKCYRVSTQDRTEIYCANDKVFFNDEIIYDTRDHRYLLGQYNIYNIMFALGVAKILELDMNLARESVNAFRPLSHRLEFVREFNRVKFYDNAIATIPEATIVAVEALGDVDTLIIGGKDRGVDFTNFIEYLNNSEINNIICMPTTGKIIAEGLLPKKVHFAKNMAEAVRIAAELTTPGKSCLLSPAAASYDFYKNFEEKGDLFQKLVWEL